MNKLFIRGVRFVNPSMDDTVYPFSIPAVKSIESIQFTSAVTFLVGENGSGKSTIIESVAVAAGFNAEGGTKNYNFSTQNTISNLADKINLVRGMTREKYGYFLRAESFYTMANYTEKGAGPTALLFDGKHIHEQSHGEAFLSIIKSFRPGLFILDEPESALSPQRQLSFLLAIHDLAKQGSQFIIATHSPIIMAYPGASIYQLSENGVSDIRYDDIEHIKLTRDFLSNTDLYLNKLFSSI